MMAIEDETRIFEIRAYKKAALTIETLQEDVEDIYAKGGIKALMELPGVGKSLAEKIEEYIKTGRMKKYDDYKKKYPIDLKNLTQIQSLGARKVFRLYKSLGVRNIGDLKKAIGKKKVRKLKGFGEKSESELAKGITMLESGGGRMLLGKALPEAEAMIRKIKESGLAERAEIAGSTRRRKETVGDLDLLVITKSPEKMSTFIEKMREVEGIIVKGQTKITVRLRIGLNCDVRMLERKSFGAATQYFIGNKAHNVKLRQIAIKKSYKLNEYGLFNKKGRRVAGEEEKEIYEILGLQYMEPEMREDRGEIELAVQHKIPKLVQLEDICGDLHIHTTYSDGSDTMEEMIKAAITLGREYIGFTDHSKSEYVAKGMNDSKFRKYSAELDSLKKKYEGRIKILKSAETDILKDGRLDFGRKILEEMDYVLATIHTNLNMPQKEMTDRLVRCIESGMVDMIAHPTDRLINLRPPLNLDLDRVFQAAQDNGVVMEIDSFPERLDLGDENIIKAREYKLKFAIDTDSHRTTHMGFMRYGVYTAKRGWLKKEDVINTLRFGDLMKHFAKRG